MKFKLGMALVVSVLGLAILLPTALASEREDALLGWVEKYREAISDTSSNHVDDITSRMQ